MFSILVAFVAVVAGAVAAIAGAGVGSTLAPLLAFQIDLKLAIAAVALPHLVGSALRYWQLRCRVDRRVLLGFGATSAVFSLLGAWLYGFAASALVTKLFAAMLILAGLSGLFGLAERFRLGRETAWGMGALSGFLGGFAGEQGGFRSASLLGFQVEKEAFVATASAIGLVVDVARLPVYWVGQWHQLLGVWPLVAIASLGVALGTLLGNRLLERIPQSAFSRVVSGIILAVGILLIFRPGGA